MILFSDYVAWQNYAATKLSEAEIEETRADAGVRYAEAIAMMAMPISAKVTVSKAQLATVEDVTEARSRVIEAYATRKTTSMVYANCERVVSLISRELSRRIASTPTDRRNNRWNP